MVVGQQTIIGYSAKKAEQTPTLSKCERKDLR